MSTLPAKSPSTSRMAPRLPTAKEYRDRGYAIDDRIPDDEVVTNVQSDQYGAPGTVTLPDGSTYEAPVEDRLATTVVEKNDGEPESAHTESPGPVEPVEDSEAEHSNEPPKRGSPEGSSKT